MRSVRLNIICVGLPALTFLVLGEPCVSQTVDKDSVAMRLDTVEVSGEFPVSRMTARTFSSREISAAPGSLNDPMRAMDLSAEVVSNADLQAVPIIGGDQADGILTLLDGFPITFPYRLLGSFSMFNPLTTSRIELMTGGYPVTNGGYAPSAISVSSNLDYNSRARLETDVTPFASSVLFQLPVSDTLRWSARFAARASHIGLAADMLSGSSRQRLEAFMPDLEDAQFFMSQMPSRNVYSFQEALASREHGSLVTSSRTFDYAWQKEFAGAVVMTSSAGFSSEHRISWTHDDIALSTMVPIEYIGSGRFGTHSQFTTVRLQEQLKFDISSQASLNSGADVAYSISHVGLETFSSWLNGRSPLRSSFADLACFSELDWTFADRLSATVGVRGTYFGFIGQLGLEPRATLTYAAGNGSSVRISAGQYLQAPSDFVILHGFLMFLSVPDQTPLMMLMSQYRDELRPETNNIVSLSANTPVVRSRGVEVDCKADLYFKNTGSLILPARYPSVFTPLDTMSYEPLQCFSAVKWGMGVSAGMKVMPLDLSFTASLFNHHSSIVDNRTGDEFRAVGDVPVVAKFFAQFSPPGWTFSILYQYSTGTPTTDGYYLKGSNLLGEVVYLPAWCGLNSNRIPDYRRLDFSVAKGWYGPGWKMDVVFGVLNVLGNENVSGYRYNLSQTDPDYVRKAAVINTLPFVPNLEIRFSYLP